MRRLEDAFLANLLAMIRQVESHERELATIYRECLSEVQALLADAHLRYGRDGTIPYAEAAKYGRLTALESQMVAELKRMGDREVKVLDKAISGVYVEGYQRAAWTLDMAGVDVSFARLPTETIHEIIRFPWSGLRYSDRIHQDTQRLASQVKETVTRGMIRGDSVQRMAEELQTRLGTGHSNAARIIRTESIHFANAGAMRTFEEAGVDRVQWLATLDAGTCSDCGDMDGRIWPIGEAPLPPKHPNCRCTLIPVIEGAPAGSRIARDSDGSYLVSDDTTYEQWYAEHIEPKVLPKTAPAPDAHLPEALMASGTLGVWIPRNTEIRNVYVIAGNGVSTALRNAEALAAEYGGQPADWQKLVGKVVSDRYEFDVHWEQNPEAGAVRAKVKSFRERRPTK